MVAKINLVEPTRSIKISVDGNIQIKPSISRTGKSPRHRTDGLPDNQSLETGSVEWISMTVVYMVSSFIFKMRMVFTQTETNSHCAN